jgi:hypothetical protein
MIISIWIKVADSTVSLVPVEVSPENLRVLQIPTTISLLEARNQMMNLIELKENEATRGLVYEVRVEVPNV